MLRTRAANARRADEQRLALLATAMTTSTTTTTRVVLARQGLRVWMRSGADAHRRRTRPTVATVSCVICGQRTRLHWGVDSGVELHAKAIKSVKQTGITWVHLLI